VGEENRQPERAFEDLQNASNLTGKWGGRELKIFLVNSSKIPEIKQRFWKKGG